MRQMHKQENAKFNALFLPGLPGEYRDRPLTENIKLLGGDIYTVSYPGTYGQEGRLSIENARQTIAGAIDELSKTGKPTIIIAYSFSTLFIQEYLQTDKNIAGVFMFSPIADLSQSIRTDFPEEIELLNERGMKIGGAGSFAEYLTFDWDEVKKKYLDVTKNISTPIIYCIGEQDPVINVARMEELLDEVQGPNKFNRLSNILVENATHKMDEIYQESSIFKHLVAIVVSLELQEKFGALHTFLWGATLNYRYASGSSDIDIAIVGKEFPFSTYVELNEFINAKASEYGVKLDIIVNTYDELKTDERIRSNRGVSFVHELDYYYFPLTTNRFELPKKDADKIKADAVFADEMNLYKSKKALLNYVPRTSESNWIVKDFIIGCIYDQYIKGNLTPNQNKIEDYYKETDTYLYELLCKCRELKKNYMRGTTLSFLMEVVTAHHNMNSRSV